MYLLIYFYSISSPLDGHHLELSITEIYLITNKTMFTTNKFVEETNNVGYVYFS